MGVSRKYVTTCAARHAAEGEQGLVTRSSRPHSTPTRTSSRVEQAVLAARRVHRDAPDLLAPRVGVAAQTVSRIVARHHAPRLQDCDQMTEVVIRASTTTAVRYGRDRPGELMHVYVKKLGKIPDDGGWRAHGPPETSVGKGRRVRIGYDFVRWMVEDYTRLAFSARTTRKSIPALAYLTRAAAYVAGQASQHRASDDRQRVRLPARPRLHRRRRRDRREAEIHQPHCPW